VTAKFLWNKSVEWWHALKTLNVSLRLVVYPNEGHMLVKPADARDYFRANAGMVRSMVRKASGR